MPRTLMTTHVVKTPTAHLVQPQQQIATPPSTPSSSSGGGSVATVMWSAGAPAAHGGGGGGRVAVAQSPVQLASAKPDPDYVPVTPTSSISSLPTNNIALTPSSSGFNNRGRTTAAIAIVKQEGHRLMTKPNNLIPVGAGGLKLASTPQQQQQQYYVATTPGGASTASGDHEYGQYSTPQQGKKTIYLTPSSSGGGGVAGGGPKSVGPTSAILLSAGGSGPAGRTVVRSEARRKLNLDAAAAGPVVDPEGFKTPIKSAAKRKAQDMSSPSPKKRKSHCILMRRNVSETNRVLLCLQ